jgi:hypothetical protein
MPTGPPIGGLACATRRGVGRHMRRAGPRLRHSRTAQCRGLPRPQQRARARFADGVEGRVPAYALCQAAQDQSPLVVEREIEKFTSASGTGGPSLFRASSTPSLGELQATSGWPARSLISFSPACAAVPLAAA